MFSEDLIRKIFADSPHVDFSSKTREKAKDEIRGSLKAFGKASAENPKDSIVKLSRKMDIKSPGNGSLLFFGDSRQVLLIPDDESRTDEDRNLASKGQPVSNVLGRGAMSNGVKKAFIAEEDGDLPTPIALKVSQITEGVSRREIEAEHQICALMYGEKYGAFFGHRSSRSPKTQDQPRYYGPSNPKYGRVLSPLKFYTGMPIMLKIPDESTVSILSMEDKKLLLKQLIEDVDKLHKNGFVHLDAHLDNIGIMVEGMTGSDIASARLRVKLLDFGRSQGLNEEGMAFVPPLPMKYFSTSYYHVAPELFECWRDFESNASVATHHADWYAICAAILFSGWPINMNELGLENPDLERELQELVMDPRNGAVIRLIEERNSSVESKAEIDLFRNAMFERREETYKSLCRYVGCSAEFIEQLGAPTGLALAAPAADDELVLASGDAAGVSSPSLARRT